VRSYDVTAPRDKNKTQAEKFEKLKKNT